MKRPFHFFLLLAVALFAVQSSFSITIKPRKSIVRFVEKYNAEATSFENLPILPKEQRVSSNRGNLVLIYDETLPDSVKTAIEVARSLWESRIPNSQPVYISVVFEPIDPDVAMLADVYYFESPKGYPSSLVSQISGIPNGSPDYPDGFIILNSDININCAFSSNVSSGYNVSTLVMRGIAMCYGFGSSVKQADDNNFEFPSYGPTLFDKLVRAKSSGNLLTSYKNVTQELRDFVTSDDVCAATYNSTYDLYAPKIYEPYRSLLYFKNDSSLMSYSLAEGNASMQIDDATVDILNAIGWKTFTIGDKIVGSGISSNGIGSAYEPHTFKLNPSQQDADGYEWTFKLKTKSDGFSTVSTGNESSFTIGKIQNPDDYFVNLNGDLEGLVECTYIVDGRARKANSLMLSLELLPIIDYISEPVLNYNGDYTFNASFTIGYKGADYAVVEVEEDFNKIVRAYRFYEPFIAHAKTGKITSLYDSWITVIIRNKYGETVETMHFAPTYIKGFDSTTAGIEDNNISVEENARFIKVYSINGKLVYSGQRAEFKPDNLTHGVYILKSYKNSTCTVTTKLVVK